GTWQIPPAGGRRNPALPSVGALTLGLDHVGQARQPRQQPAQGVQAGNLDGQRHQRGVVFLVAQGVDRQHVDLLIEQQLRHVAQQAGTVVGADDDLRRVGLDRYRAPADLDDAVRLAAFQMQHRRAVLAVDAHAAALGDVADDGVAGQRLAAAGHLGQQIADALDLDVAAPAGARHLGGAASRDQLQLGIAIRLDQLLSLVDQMCEAYVAGTQGGEHVLHRLEVGALDQFLVIDADDVQAGQLALQHGLAGDDVLLAGLLLEPVDDLGPGTGGGDIAQVGVQPVTARRPALLGGDDLHLLAGLQAVVERHDAPVDLGAPAVVADLGVHPVGEVQRRGALGQVHGVAIGGEYVDPVRLEIHAQLLGQAADVAQLLVPFQHLAQPGDLLLVVGRGGFDVGALVAPVGAHAQLGLLVHGVGADLHFQHLALRADHRGVQRAVAVLLGVGDVVVELLGNVPPQGVHDAQGGVAVVDFRHQHAHRAHVVDLAELQTRLLHLPPDGIDVLDPAADVGLDAGGVQPLAQLVHDPGDVLLAV